MTLVALGSIQMACHVRNKAYEQSVDLGFIGSFDRSSSMSWHHPEVQR